MSDATSGPSSSEASSYAKIRAKNTLETNPSKRKRQQLRLTRKLKTLVDEFAVRVGQQAIVLIAEPNSNLRVFGSNPLRDIVHNLRGMIMQELENALAQQQDSPPQDNAEPLFELPPLIIDGHPLPLEKMTQAQLRAFIPLMLKYSTGRGKPQWGHERSRPPWWPQEVPWANVRTDVRSKEEKRKLLWTNALRKVILSCYKFHGREDLLPPLPEEDEISADCSSQTVLSASIVHIEPNNPIMVLSPDGTATTATIQGGYGAVSQEGNVDLKPFTAESDMMGVVSVSEGVPVYPAVLVPHLMHTNSDGTFYVTPVVSKVETVDGEAKKVVRTYSRSSCNKGLQEGSVLTKALADIAEVKDEEPL